jgi:hypothetical protein
MQVLNVHERELQVGSAEVGALLDSLASENDRLWPRACWPAMRFDRPLGVGAVGGIATAMQEPLRDTAALRP